MLKIDYFKISLYITLAIHASQLNANHIGSLYTSDWHLVEDITITQPKEASNTLSNNAIYIIATLSAFCSTQVICTKTLSYCNISRYDQSAHVYKIIKTALSSAVGVATCLGFKKAFEEKNEINTLKNFIAQWPSYKAYAPKELRLSFDELYELHTKNLVSDTKIKQVIRLLKMAVHNKFPEKYQDKKSESFFNFKKFEADARIEAGNFLRGMAELWRAAKSR